MNQADTETLENVKVKLRDLAKELLKVWNERQSMTDLQETTMRVFGKIHDVSDPVQYCQTTLELLHDLINALPPKDREIVDANSCHEGFMNWNRDWLKYSLNNDTEPAIKNVHLFYHSWVEANKDRFCEFQDLWELCMIRSTSES